MNESIYDIIIINFGEYIQYEIKIVNLAALSSDTVSEIEQKRWI